jgi:S-adenosylmethionine:tRNA ribosyltransferase-isomerase
MAVRASDFDYPLDEALIAQEPLARRDQSRLMVLRRADRRVEHHVFSELPALLRAGDVMVLNTTAVIPAKFACRRKTGGRVEGLFLRERAVGEWEVMLRGAGRCRGGEELPMEGTGDVSLRLVEDLGEGRWRVAVAPPAGAMEVLGKFGATPLPPYIRRRGPDREEADRPRYQTVYASVPGAVAAPTAGLHFTPELLRRLEEAGVQLAKVTLHVGTGTFLPVKSEDLSHHAMHSEWYDLPATAADLLNAARREGRRIVAVGTTSVRVLETAWHGSQGRSAHPAEPCLAATQRGACVSGEHGANTLPSGSPLNGIDGHATPFTPQSGWTDIFIYPPYEFRAVDALVTNFHLPRSTLLMLVAAFCSPGSTDGIGMILAAYEQAAQLRYRFYSYGDAMLIE